MEGNAEQLPFPDESFDLYTIVFGLRNVTNKDVSCLRCRSGVEASLCPPLLVFPDNLLNLHLTFHRKRSVRRIAC